MLEITDFLQTMVEQGGSDLYIAAGASIRCNINGVLHAYTPDPLTPEMTHYLVKQLLTEQQWSEFYQRRELNLAYSLKNLARFRVNVYFQRGSVAAVIRLIKMQIPSFAELNLPKTLGEIALAKRGLILVTGATGSGKSTTMAAMIDYRAEHHDGHIVTVEDPVEYVFRHKKSIVTQREVGIDTYSFKEALKNTLRQAPNVIYIGELRDSETVEFALHSAETGHLVLATLHSTNASQTIERIVNFFPKEYFHSVYLQLAGNLRAIISQRLIPRKIGGRVPVLEILINTALVSELILKNEFGSLKKVMEGGKNEGMQTFDQHLYQLVQDNCVTEEEALKYADSATDLRLRLRGFQATTY
ncbi:MAG: type IV pilus ATPase PilU [Candidatus Sumerlaeia bacterium]